MPIADVVPTTRYPLEQRWTGVLAAEIGKGFDIIEEGLSGRTTDVDDPADPRLNGSSFIVISSLFGGAFGTATIAQAAKCTPEQGQLYIHQGRYNQAIREFSCLIDNQPTEVEGYRGRIEAELLQSLFSDAFRDYTRVTAVVLPIHPDARSTIYDGYAARLAVAPESISALTGLSFARWYNFDYNQTIHILNVLLDVQPDNVYGNLFRGSSRLLQGATRERGIIGLPILPEVTTGWTRPFQTTTTSNR
jgi:tetratricopeptide (TPR) repeat protein